MRHRVTSRKYDRGELLLNEGDPDLEVDGPNITVKDLAALKRERESSD